MELSRADHSVSPPRIEIPRAYNAAYDLIERNLQAGRGAKAAFHDDAGSITYAQLAERVNRFGGGLLAMGLRMEDRVLIAMHDTIDWPVAFLGAIRAGIVPVAVNTLLTTKDYEYMLSDSRAQSLIVSEALLPQFTPIVGKLPFLKHVIVSGASFNKVLEKGAATLAPAPTTCDDACFWLYSSGSTGMPKGTVHAHASMVETAELYARGVLGLKDSDVVFSAAKLFFAYGLGNSLSFSLAVGATSVLMAERPTPAAVFKRLTEKKPTLFYGVPTLYAAMLADAAFPKKEALALRICVSAGEALPPQIAKSFKDKAGLEILDGIGSTEMLHIFLSNRPGDLRYGTTGKAVPGYALRLVDEQGKVVEQGELGELEISGTTSALYYWNNRAKSRATFVGAWTKSGDKYTQDADGFYAYGGRTDDMLKVSGIWVSPAEVEAALVGHPAVLEAAVVGKEDEQKLVKPKAYVVLKPGAKASEEELKAHVKEKLAPYKYPRWIEFAAELPKTATGKIQRFKLRA
ncbi:MAG: benzoate-CoA ligase family protein [Betaproteobacteria bacterium]|nr:benzoate-CoA ligase family protein [Betaproteobacteria bacterium]MDH4323444.1 benzoate-CoA ligase family protein [Betaproteobacteria bacterium]